MIGLSILSGAHNAIVPRVMELLREKDMTDVMVVVGGIVPDEDAEALKRQGVAAVFQPGASLEEIVSSSGGRWGNRKKLECGKQQLDTLHVGILALTTIEVGCTLDGQPGKFRCPGGRPHVPHVEAARRSVEHGHANPVHAANFVGLGLTSRAPVAVPCAIPECVIFVLLESIKLTIKH